MTARGALAISLALVAACGGDEGAATPSASEPPATAIKKVTENGPVSVTVQLWPPAPTLVDPIHLRLTVVSQAGVTVDLPFQQEELGRFGVASYTRNERRERDKRIQVQDYVLDAPASGRQRIPPFRLEMVDSRGSAAAPQELLTEEIPIQIGEVSTDLTTATLPAARGPLSSDVGGTAWWYWVGLALVVIWIALGVLIYLRMRERRAVRIKLTAYDVAVSRLRALEERGAPDAGEGADAWFVELSSIIRDYLEARYDIRAPELTTEEFLIEATRSNELTEAHRELLTSFMERCDRVKFAGYRPEAAESLDTLRAARGFVEDTRLRPEQLDARRAA